MTNRRWVLIETSGNQRYIFGSSRLRHVVGASHLVHEIGTVWVPDEAARLGLEDPVMTASGKALLLVDSSDAGRDLIRAVTGRALRDAPGLRVTGVVGPAFDPADPHAHEPARRDTYALHAAARAARPDLLLRDRVFPWHLLCRDSGLPAAGEEYYGPERRVPAATGVLTRSAATGRGHRRLSERLGTPLDVVVPSHLDELVHGGWVAVVHADGNGVGGLFRDFLRHVWHAERPGGAAGDTGPVPLQTHAEYQGAVARELDAATWDAVRDAVAQVAAAHSPAGSAGQAAVPPASVSPGVDRLAGRLLPVVVGGDDVTVVCDAVLAVPFVRAFAAAFTRHTAAQPTLSAITRAATGQAGLTASAGIAIVKLHHPFAVAYDLAEALTAAAKQFSHDGRPLAAFDLHVVHTSTLRDLTELREYAGAGEGDGAGGARVARHAGPYLIDDPDDLPDALRARNAAQLDKISDWLGPRGWLSATQAHALREAADRSLTEYLHQLALTLGRSTAPPEAHDLLAVQDGGDRPPFLRLFDAMQLRGLRLTEPPAAARDNGPDGDDR
ncbi:hypothetical protein [Dactylosporangium sp. NPDC005555]|uniref:Cas10/Cmr2 second palm domain-containing protein n=1 Tax=Dactylosporangium sp. NPDC005555 TaxID=3154889 RepID=UPI0033A1E13E